MDKTGTWTGVVQVLNKQRHIKTKHTIELQDVLYIPELRTNLFSIKKEIKTKGATISNYDDMLILTYPDGSCIHFDHIISTAKGFIPAARIKALDMQPSNIQYNVFHTICSHQFEKYTRETAKKLGINLTGSPEDCIHCARGKIKKTKI